MKISNSFKNKKGLVLAETLLSIAMLSIGVVIVANIITTSIKSTSVSKNYLIGQNLATEAVESIKSIRDTNWLREPDNKECWLRLDVDKGCGEIAKKGDSYIAKNPDNYWKLVFVNAELNIANGAEANTAFRLNRETKVIGDKKFEVYVHNPDLWKNASPFYRSVYFTDVAGDQSQATVEVRVQWKEGSKVHELKRDLTLFNYL